MSDAAAPKTVLSPEDEELALQAATSTNWSESYVADAEQAIGRTFSIDTNSARPIFDELVCRNLIEARPEHPAANKLEPDYQPRLVRAKWFRTGEA
jgi:hypothetical protein